MQQYPVDSVSLHVHRVHPTVSHLQSVYTEFIQQYPIYSQSTQRSSNSIPSTVSLHRVHPTVSHGQSVYTEFIQQFIQQYLIDSQSTSQVRLTDVAVLTVTDIFTVQARGKFVQNNNSIIFTYESGLQM